ncbi:MAG: NADH-quinone oxidoreductase subunit D [Chlamydiae bacterium]|nr:NADH-quinone oxidoreductase subunit D [Chlamydiota bacterium]MBI3277820.1 NADH-quinone oxidoreductase subunit D [Chlamydiota bacterium]
MTEVNTQRNQLFQGIPVESSVEHTYAKTGFNLEIIVPKSNLRDLAKRFRDQKYFIEVLSIVDYPDRFEACYQFNRWEKLDRILVKVRTEKSNPHFPTISDIYQGANWYEREGYDLFGVIFDNHPNLTRLLLPENATIHPMRKDFKPEEQPTDVEDVLKLMEYEDRAYERVSSDLKNKYQKDYFINMGPQHPSTHGVLRLLLHLDGERVLDVLPIIGYSHRDHEKMAEKKNYLQFTPNMGRMDYVGAMSFNFGYIGLIEKAMGIIPSQRSEYIRVLSTELNRIASHLLWLGTYLLDLGAFTPFFYCFDDREDILDMLELLTGERLTYNFFRFGGVAFDIPEEFKNRLKAFIPKMRIRLKDYKILIEKNIIFEKRTKEIGVVTKENAISYGITGPSLRACGIPYDLRKCEPYSIYPELNFEIPVFSGCDTFARYQVRMAEIEQSLRIAEQTFEKMPEGQIKGDKAPKTSPRVPKGETYFAVESARGSYGEYLVSDGGANPYRLKQRTPSYANLSALGTLLHGHLVADVVTVLGSIDVVIPEIDR